MVEIEQSLQSSLRNILDHISLLRLSEPIASRGDMRQLKSCFEKNKDWATFIRAWAIREPYLVRAFYRGGFKHALACPHRRYQYLPLRLVKYMKPSVVARWSYKTVQQVGNRLGQALRTGTVEDYKNFVRLTIRLLHGVGKYSAEHLYRTGCLMMDVSHPSQEFVVMGTGATSTSYKFLRCHNIRNMQELNSAMKTRGRSPLDAGELAYLVCMGNKIQRDHDKAHT
jgi:hypothetical protein